ncbi:transposase [Pseudonocardia sp. ICBG601]|uniref:transposase n=1 Tax=Pseudonocardia sp. ICBG601 TaxID=2846759 RepID=UPI001CF70B78|nr:transposase [Pseudonocardia sp. ICBG601]
MVGVSGWSTRLGCSIVVGMQERPRRYPSDTSDAQWVVIEPLLPPLARRGRPVAHARRDVLDAILYVVRTGCACGVAGGLPPWQTVYWYFNQWEQQKVTEKILPVVRGQLRIAEGRDRSRVRGSSIPSRSRAPTPSARTPAATTPGRRQADGNGSS